MTNKSHERATQIVFFVTFCIALLAGWSLASSTIVAVFIFVGEYFLSSDLDTRSRPYIRWGYLKWIWKPYQKLFHHRSVFTHFPILGTVVRLIYLSPIWFPLAWWSQEWHYFVLAAVGIEISSVTHCLLDL